MSVDEAIGSETAEGGLPESGAPTFGHWLGAVARKAGLSGAAELREWLAENDVHCTEGQVAEWLEGASEPSLDKMRGVIRALAKALPQLDVWEEYRLFRLGKPFLQPKRSGVAPGAPTLEEMADRSSRLPPPLTD